MLLYKGHDYDYKYNYKFQVVPKASSVSSSSTASESSAILQYVHRLRVSLSVVSSYALRVELTVKVALVLTNTAPTASHSMALWCCIPADKVIVWVNQKHICSEKVYSSGHHRFIPLVTGGLFLRSSEIYYFDHQRFISSVIGVQKCTSTPIII